jgi:hypothetical protein
MYVCFERDLNSRSKSKNTYCAKFEIEKGDILIQGDGVIINSYGVNNFNI